MVEFGEDQRYGVENSVLLYAESFYVLGANDLYSATARDLARSCSDSFHVYLIGRLPVVERIDVSMAKGYFTTRLLVAGRERFLAFPCPLDAHIEWIQGRKYIRNRAGHILAIPSDQELHSELTTKHKCFDFEVLYVGQSFGDEGDRDAIDRLLKHETLQKISILENKAGHTLAVLLLSLPRHHSSITLINPRAADTTQNEARIGIGLQNSNVATERDRVTLFEASLIRHFRPEYNEKFKDSFPSTKTKALKECYNKDILSVIAEISFPEIPFRIYSQHVRPEKYVFINHNLHSDSDRRLYFFDEPSGR